MSAWAELVNADGSDEWLELCSRAMEEVQRVAQSRAAAMTREHTRADYAHVLAAYGSAYANGWRHGRDRAADLVEGETT